MDWIERIELNRINLLLTCYRWEDSLNEADIVERHLFKVIRAEEESYDHHDIPQDGQKHEGFSTVVSIAETGEM